MTKGEKAKVDRVMSSRRLVCVHEGQPDVCSLHFVGGNGPTVEDPDPISAVASKERVS